MLIPVQYAFPFLAFALACAAVEYRWRLHRGMGYDLGALGANLGVMVGFFISRLLTGGIVTLVFSGIYALTPLRLDPGSPLTWVAGFFAVEFFYYWQHRLSHTVRWFWAGHSVHHSANQFTLPAAFRLSWFGTFTGAWLVLTPLLVMGFHPLVVAVLMMINLNYQYFLHTEAVGKLGPLEWVFNTPSHHRVHHGANAEYLDRNFGGVLIIFDRMFGTFAEEREDTPVVFGLTKPLASNNPVTINLHEWAAILRDIRKARSPREVWQAIGGSPGNGPDQEADVGENGRPIC